MGLANVSKVTLILPRTESPKAVSRLAEFQWFHTTGSTSDHSNPELDELLLKSQRLFQNIDEIVRSLDIKVDVGIIDTMVKGVQKTKQEFTVSEIKSLIDDLDLQAGPVVKNVGTLVEERSTISKSLDEYEVLKASLSISSNLQIDLSKLSKGKLFFTNMFIVLTKDIEEIQSSLDDIYSLPINLTNTHSALFVVSSHADFDRINKVIRSFDASPFVLPPHLPQNPKSAMEFINTNISQLTARKKELDKKIEKTSKEMTPKILSLYEGAKFSRDVLDVLRRPGGSKHFAIIQGYIPTEMREKFQSLTQDWTSIVEEENLSGDTTGMDDHNKHHTKKPSLFKNNRYFRAFEPITLTQGLPNSNEIDPTPIISFIFPILYGLMFGDAGQGAIIAILGAVFRIRAVGNLKKWGTLLMASGISAIIVGLIVGEAFGFHIVELPGAEILKSTGFIGILNAADFTQENVMIILTISVNIGILHLINAFILSIYKGLREGKRFEVMTQRIPVLIMYMSIISIMLAAVGANYQVLNLFSSQNPTPFFSNVAGDWVTVELVSKIGFPILLATMIIQIISVPLGVKRGAIKLHGPLGEEMFMTVIEVMLIRLVEFFANTISYTRIGIMLLVHVALMSTTNGGVEHFMAQGNIGPAIFMLLLGNVGVMLIEGLLVYIQALRLHLYEWFTKFYEGSGLSFRKIVPDMIYTTIVWKPTEQKIRERQ